MTSKSEQIDGVGHADDSIEAAVRENPRMMVRAVRRVQREDHTPETYRKLCEIAVASGLRISDLANDGNDELYLAFVTDYSEHFFEIPFQFRTLDFCLTAIKRNNYVIDTIMGSFERPHDPKDPLTDSDRTFILKEAILIDPLTSYNLNSKYLWTKELKLLAASINGMILNDISADEYDNDLIIAAITQCARAINFVDKPTRQHVRLAYSKDRLTFALIRDSAIQIWLVKSVLVQELVLIHTVNLSINLLSEIVLVLIADSGMFPMAVPILLGNPRYEYQWVRECIGLPWELPYHAVVEICRQSRRIVQEM